MNNSSDDRNKHLERLSATINVMPWGILTVEDPAASALVVFSNNQAGFDFNITAAEIIGRNVNDLLKNFGITEDMGSFLRSKKTCCYDFEKKQDASSMWYRLHFIPHREERAYCLIVIEDTTENKMLEKQFLQSQRLEALGQLAGGVAHDFNNILSIIDGYAYMIRKLVAGREDVENYVERLAQAVKRGAALTGQLLTFGRHKMSKDSVIDLGKLVHDQESLLRPLMDASITMSFDTQDNIFIDAQEDQICQILLNLSVNARDAMPNGGLLCIDVSAEEGGACLRVSDTGCGMTHDVQQRIFDPFFSTKDDGTGLGLSMVYGIVTELGGGIHVKSELDHGTLMSVHLPLSQKKPTLEDVKGTTTGKIALNGYTALIAEDEPDLLELVSGMIEDMGVRVLQARNGSEALSMQQDYDGRIDFLLTDVVMPDVNGVKLAEMFESARPSARVMFMSGYPEESAPMVRASLPPNAFLVHKPVNYDKLGHMLTQMVRDQNNQKRLSPKRASSF